MCALALSLPFEGNRRSSRFGIACALALCCLAVSLCILPGAARAATVIELEAENLTAMLNLGGNAINYVSCGAARGGLAVDGVDYEGDYIEWPLTLEQDFVFRDSLRTAGATGVVRQFAILFLPSGAGEPAAAETLTTPAGLGIG
jgi:hypothetical protein